MRSQIQVDSIKIGEGNPPVIIAGLCVIENLEHTLGVATQLKEICAENGFSLIFKASFDKANRSSIESYRGPGLKLGLETLYEVKRKTELLLLTDIHEPDQAEVVAQVVDILQIPAFLCRQTDLLIAAAETGKVVNLKKGQFIAPWDMKNVLDKIIQSGNDRVVITERGTSFGYNNLVTDLRSLSYLRNLGVPVIMDVTHSLQLPGGLGNASGGQAEYVTNLARAALAWGCDGLFMEVHERPEKAKSDGPNTLGLTKLDRLLQQLKAIYEALNRP